MYKDKRTQFYPLERNYGFDEDEVACTIEGDLVYGKVMAGVMGFRAVWSYMSVPIEEIEQVE